ncbi:MAG: thiamine pyrophosphate-dependent enzyme [Deltaproteobacteria bacterium]|nr:thiamine pyrophosphate-dependent enzyme [Deltaproteobacteria bacterium]
MKRILLGNEAIAWGLINSSVDVVSGYPGTPSSEILSTYQFIQRQFNIEAFAEWSTNEKVGFEVAYAAAVANKRSCATMKQVGLNVASDALMSAAYIGNKGGFVLVVTDDPGFYSSQTEQDSRMVAKQARIPVFDPANPKEAYHFTRHAVELSEKFETPVMLRSLLRVCHSRQIVEIEEPDFKPREGKFVKDVSRWAALPRKTRLIQAYQQMERIQELTQYNWEKLIKPKTLGLKPGKLLILTAGTSHNFVLETMESLELAFDVLKLDMPYPLPIKEIRSLFDGYEMVLVVEETTPLIEEQILTSKVKGKLSGDMHLVDEMTNDKLLKAFQKIGVYQGENIYPNLPYQGEIPDRVPKLCAGCPHRDVYFALKKVFKRRAVYPSDIGCYTLGINQGVIDTVLCMGGSIGMAIGFSVAKIKKPIVATIGDSTFLHAGIPPLITAIYTKQKFVLVILDNSTTAMTGRQPTAEQSPQIDIKKIVEGLGLQVLEYVYENQMEKTVDFFKAVQKHSEESELPTVALVREFCVLDKPMMLEKPLPGQFATVDQDLCNSCKRCMVEFNCPPFYWNDNKKIEIDPNFCVGCGACMNIVCPTDAFIGDDR